MIRIVFFISLAIFIVIAGLVFLLNQRFKNPPTTYIIKKDDLAKVLEECETKSDVSNEGFQGMLNDVHVHTMPQGNQTQVALKLLAEMNASGVGRVVVQPNHSPGNASQLRSLDNSWGQIAKVCPRIITLLYGFNPDEGGAWEYVQKQLDTGNFGGVGEIEFQHGNLPIKHDPESPSMQKIYQILEEKGLALHFQASLAKDPSLREKLLRIFKAHPKLNFVWFNCSLDGEFLDLPNVYCDTFFHSRSFNFSEVILKKSLIGSDASPKGVFNPGARFLPYKNVGEAGMDARNKLSSLPKEVADALAFENFNKIWPR